MGQFDSPAMTHGNKRKTSRKSPRLAASVPAPIAVALKPDRLERMRLRSGRRKNNSNHLRTRLRRFIPVGITI